MLLWEPDCEVCERRLCASSTEVGASADEIDDLWLAMETVTVFCLLTPVAGVASAVDLLHESLEMLPLLVATVADGSPTVFDLNNSFGAVWRLFVAPLPSESQVQSQKGVLVADGVADFNCNFLLPVLSFDWLRSSDKCDSFSLFKLAINCFLGDLPTSSTLTVLLEAGQLAPSSWPQSTPSSFSIVTSPKIV